MPFVIALGVLILILIFSAMNVLNEYERMVVFTLGRFSGIKGPGLVLIWPLIQRTRRVDLRVIVLSVPKQDV
ncbi:MAG TPA: SPFH domain-containing protein, partial [Steroidobacteraceae bacterium]|nr:SPFH domain-containing protein [Steroidobacteraceae bacterium]